jgi:Kef-type K+ transport system membrane component KefB
MPDVEFVNLLGVLVIALGAPLLLGFAPRARVPAVVLEIVLGIVVGPSLLGWLEADLAVEIVALLGLAMLLFLAGLEIDVHRLRGRLLGYAATGYLISLVVGWGAGATLVWAGWLDDSLLLAVTVSATSLGLVVAVLKDGGVVETRLGQTVIAASSVADFAAVLLLSLVFSESSGSTGTRLLLLGVFVGTVLLVGLAVALSARSMRLGEVLERLQDSTAEIRVRAAMVMLIAFVVLAERFGLESILGAFMAGAAVGLLDRDASSHPRFRVKLDAIGYGFLIPVFFVASGLRLDVAGLLQDPGLLYLGWFGPRRTAAAALLQATSLPFIVTATQIGVATGRMDGTTAAALVCAGLASVLVFPATAASIGLRGGDGDGDDHRLAFTRHAEPIP